MLENIKSRYFIKIIYSFLDEKAKLKIVKCNKNIQKILDIQLINYIVFTQKYIIKDKNGLSKVYSYNPYYEDKYDDKLIFEGKYLNGLKNGQGKEYDDETGKLIFEGEYLNGIKNGKGKEYDNGKLIFEGEYLNGEKNGKAKEYYDDKVIFEGEYLNGERLSGKGMDYEGNIYYENRNKDGLVKEYHNNGELKFEGEYLNGKRNGKGKEYDYYGGSLIFEGEYLNGERNGKGKSYDYNNEINYEGEYLNGEKHGKGISYWEGKLLFKGEYRTGKKWDGQGYDRNNNIVFELKQGKGYIK